MIVSAIAGGLAGIFLGTTIIMTVSFRVALRMAWQQKELADSLRATIREQEAELDRLHQDYSWRQEDEEANSESTEAVK